VIVAVLQRAVVTMPTALSNYPLGDYNQLHRAVAKGCIKQILAGLGLGVDDINAPSKTEGETPLTMASARGDIRVTKLLLERGADTESVTSTRQWTALFFSIPHPRVTRMLLERGANHGAKDSTGSTPLHMAIRGEIGDAGLEVAEILLEFGADANAKDNGEAAPLHLLAHKGRPAAGRVEAAKVLVKYGANIDAVDSQGCTPLMRTCVYVTGLVPLAKMLLREGANIDVSNTFGSTSLHLLAQDNKVCGAELLDIAMLLIEEGANIGAMDSNGSTPLHVASNFVGNLGLVKLLVERGADPDAREITGETPLHLATIAGSFVTMSVLIAAGANVNLRDRQGETPLFKAAERGHLVAVKLLLRAKASALLPRSDDGNPLEVAALMGHTDIVRELLQCVGIEGCGGPSDGARALVLAAVDPPSVDVMAILLETGVVDTGEALSNANECASMKLLVQHRLEDSDYLDRCGRPAESINGLLTECPMSPMARIIATCKPQAPGMIQFLIAAGSSLESIPGRGERMISLVNRMLLKKEMVQGEQADSDQLLILQAVQRLLLRAEAVTATSWLWPRGTGAAAPTIKTATAAPALAAMMPLLRRRAFKRGFALPAMFRCVWLFAALYYSSLYRPSRSISSRPYCTKVYL
jgi:ankyrin repeat protein